MPVVIALAPALRNCPVPVVIDHFALASAVTGTGQPGFDALLEMVAAGNVYVKLSAPYRLTVWQDARPPIAAREIARALIDARLDRMLWGTDWPHSGPGPAWRARVIAANRCIRSTMANNCRPFARG